MGQGGTLRLHSILAYIAWAIATVSAQTYYFTGAVTVEQGGGGYSPAQQAVCPAGYENRCDSIGASGYCCPSGNTCSWSNSQVMCCASGQTCSGYGSGGGAYQPTSQWVPPATTVYAAGGGGYQAPSSHPPDVYAGYCSTYYAQGPNLPTTRQGECGTVLVIEPGEGVRWALGWAKMLGMMGVLHGLGWVVFARR